MTPLSRDTTELLRDAGWTDGCRADVRPYVKALEARGFEVFDAARRFLEAFGGLFVFDDPKERYLSSAVGTAMRKRHAIERRLGRWAAKVWEWFWPVEYKPHEALISFDPTLDTIYVHHIRADYAPRLEKKICYVGLYGSSNQVLMLDETGALYMGFKEQMWKVADDAREAVDRLIRRDVNDLEEIAPLPDEYRDATDATDAGEDERSPS